jgi:transposase
VDAAHFVFGAFLGYVWSFCRLFVRGPSGRHRVNVLGALHAVTHQLITVQNATYINAQSVCELLHKLTALGLGVPITVVLDNTPYQRCALVGTLAQDLGIELLFLPPYSPNLNLIERVWKFVKRKTLYSKHYPDLAHFRAAILGCLEQLATTYKPEMDSLLTWKFQKFENVQIMPS